MTLPDKVRLLVGIGNPGLSFEGTRHNFGFSLTDYLCRFFKGTFKHTPALCCSLAVVSFEDRPVVLAKPTTYVNLIGNSVDRLCKRFSVPTQRIMVMADNVTLPFGKVTLGQKVGTGGHKGLKSINQVLKSQDYWSLKLGIGRPVDDSCELSKFVLDPFSPSERVVLNEIFEEAFVLVKKWIQETE